MKEKLIEFIKKPLLALCIIVWLAAAGAFVGTIVLAFMPAAGEWYHVALAADRYAVFFMSRKRSESSRRSSQWACACS